VTGRERDRGAVEQHQPDPRAVAIDLERRLEQRITGKRRDQRGEQVRRPGAIAEQRLRAGQRQARIVERAIGKGRRKRPMRGAVPPDPHRIASNRTRGDNRRAGRAIDAVHQPGRTSGAIS